MRTFGKVGQSRFFLFDRSFFCLFYCLSTNLLFCFISPSPARDAMSMIWQLAVLLFGWFCCCYLFPEISLASTFRSHFCFCFCCLSYRRPPMRRMGLSIKASVSLYSSLQSSREEAAVSIVLMSSRSLLVLVLIAISTDATRASMAAAASNEWW